MCCYVGTTMWHTTKGPYKRTDISPFDQHVFGTFTHRRDGHFKAHADPGCVNNQDCGLRDLGACHGCDTEQECTDMGLSSTLFVTHHREYMNQKTYNAATGKYEQVRYHCKRDGP